MGKHLIIINKSNFAPKSDIVYNKDPLNEQKVLYARSLGVEQDQQLINYFSDRKIWELDYRDNMISALSPLGLSTQKDKIPQILRIKQK